MSNRTFTSMYGFRISYPDNWAKSFDLGRVLFSSPSQPSLPFLLTINTVQTSVASVEALADQIHHALLKIEAAEVLEEQEIQLGGTNSYRCAIRYTEKVEDSNGSTQTIEKQALVVAVSLYEGKATTLMTFTHRLKDFASFYDEIVQPMLSSFELEPSYRTPAPEYRRLAREEYEVAIDFPQSWVIRGFNAHKVAFRSLEQRWQIDNVTLITKRREQTYPLRNYCALARSNFLSDPDVKVLGEYNSSLGGLPAYTIEYTIVDKLHTLNKGRQTLAVNLDGTLINLTMLAPQDKMDQYDPLFHTIYQNLRIRSDQSTETTIVGG